MPTSHSDFGDRLVAQVVFTNAASPPVLTNPDMVRWKLRAPDGTETTILHGASGTNAPTPGIYTYTFTPEASGRWVVRCEGLGAVEQAAEMVLIVRPSQLRSAAVA